MGYIGYSRSEGSADAIERFEVPLSLITRKRIDQYLAAWSNSHHPARFDMEGAWETYHGASYPDEGTIKALSTVPVKIWKRCAKNDCEPSSWHHTSKFYNQTDHYDLAMVAKAVLDYQRLFPIAAENAQNWYCEWMSSHEYQTQHRVDILLGSEFRRAESDIRDFIMERLRETLSFYDAMLVARFANEITKPELEQYFGINDSNRRYCLKCW